ncbi:hypothetical protein A3I56_01665 [Candidatus Roizmanbacteria bacterium RIFCSPLOWO2_02_FULL_43_10]|uniref:Uncharacterized protein n=1 Tax=Candidatus Roizmanbacteria bacterium RIFCSPLOWO2_02_FULL_43_10 TaxID=1802078 RepID=A0A1F7JTW1_9BACT|nr:MAG: hypothetical protein A3I56_01665 [Candidatus Roizmanbacteria bacterium RIFCSPLOWO2_02_FULL_43_10]
MLGLSYMDDAEPQDGHVGKTPSAPFALGDQSAPAAVGPNAVAVGRERADLVAQAQANTRSILGQPGLHVEEAEDGRLRASAVPVPSVREADQRLDTFLAAQQGKQPEPEIGDTRQREIQGRIATAPALLTQYLEQAQAMRLNVAPLERLSQLVKSGQAISPTMVENAAIVVGLKKETAALDQRAIAQHPEPIPSAAPVTAPIPKHVYAPAAVPIPESVHAPVLASHPVVEPQKQGWFARQLAKLGFGQKEPLPVQG